MLDLFAPFGIWLPRNSSRQAQAGEVLPLGELFGEEKEKAILDGGIPFLTLIWMKGHIGLYLGEHQGRAAFLHNVWGVKTESFWGEEGRAIVGKTVVTTLQPGAELGVGEGLRARVLGMTILRGTPTDPALYP